MARVLGICMENDYGEDVANLAALTPDFHIEATKGNFALGNDPSLSSGGSRMYQNGRAGIMKPTGNNEFDVDLETIGHFLRAFLDQYEFTEGTGDYHTHEFWGGENRELPSWALEATYDYVAKIIMGAICDGLKLEVSDEKMTASVDWIYKTEKAEMIDPDTFEKLVLDCIIPVMTYDVDVKFNNMTVADSGVYKSFSFEGKNNHNVDSTVGLGSRHPQTKALAQLRENSISITTTLTRQTVRSILDGEYGEVNAMSPSECKIQAVPLELNIALCEDPNRSLQIIFPKNIIAVEYEWDGTDDIEATINMTPMGYGEAEKVDGETVKTDMYCKLVNSRPEITTPTPATPVTPTTTDVSVSVTDGTDGINNVSVTITDSTDSTVTFTGTTGSAGGCTLTNVPYGSYVVEATATGYDTYNGTLTVSAYSSTLNITMTEDTS